VTELPPGTRAGPGWAIPGVLLAVTLLLALALRLRLGRLPGDLAVERGNWRFYFPIVTCLLLSLLMTLVLWLISALRR